MSSHIQLLSWRGITSPSSIVIFTSQYQYDLWNVLCAMYCLLMKSGGQMQIVDCLEFGSGVVSSTKAIHILVHLFVAIGSISTTMFVCFFTAVVPLCRMK